MQGRNMEEGEINLKNIVSLKMDDLIDFSEHPFKVMEDEKMNELVESILERGVLEPIIVRPFKGKYEIIAGHRRKAACIIAGLNEIRRCGQKVRHFMGSKGANYGKEI